MTETSPVVSVARLDGDQQLLPQDEQAELRAGQGRAGLGVELRVVDPDTLAPVPRDGTSSGELQARGNWIASSYYDDERAAESFTPDGWLRTGDVATMNDRGQVRLVDRTKDLIKSGGEWISSVELENELMAHPLIREAAVIGVPDAKWSERPLACVVLEEGADDDRRRTSSTTSRRRSPSGSCPTTSSSSTRSRRRPSASSPRRPCGSGSRIARDRTAPRALRSPPVKRLAILPVVARPRPRRLRERRGRQHPARRQRCGRSCRSTRPRRRSARTPRRRPTVVTSTARRRATSGTRRAC